MKKCEFCGKMVEDEEIVEFNVVCDGESKPIATSYICKDCYKPLEGLTEDDFSKLLSNYLKSLSTEWENGNKDNSKVNSIIKIVSLKGEEEHIYLGRTGIITEIDKDGRLHGSWGDISISPEYDTYLVLKGDIINGKKD